MIYILEEEIVHSGRYDIIESYSNMKFNIYHEDERDKKNNELYRRYLATTDKENYYYLSYYIASDIQKYEKIVMSNK